MKFELQDIELEVFLGVHENERSRKQKILVSIFFELNVEKAAISDKISDSLDYQEIYDLIQSFCGKKSYKLLEKLHKDLKIEILEKFPAVQNLSVKICKFPFKSGKVCVRD